MTQPAIHATGICKSFRTGQVTTPVLDGLCLSVERGALTLVAGPSGCGKSTLLAILSGLQRPDRGTVTALDVELGALDARAIERFRLIHTGFVFQGFNLFPALTAVEQVALPLGYLGWQRERAADSAMQALREVGLQDRAAARPAELSGGEKQRVAIARAIAKQPDLLFADEPTSALDAASGQVVIDMLHGIARSRGVAVLCVSHDPRLLSHADRLLTMEDGRILTDQRYSGVARSLTP